MLLAIDVGNTNITMGVFDGDQLLGTFRMASKQYRTSDEYGILIKSMMKNQDLEASRITDVIIGSVVPDVMYSLSSGIIKYFHARPLIVGPGIKTGIRLTSANPREIGADRIVDTVAAYEQYGGPVLVLDFGTATTYDLVMEDGSFSVGITAPGIEICAKALWEDAAKLPKIEMRKPATILATDTISSMQAGLIYGNIGQTEYIIRKVKEDAHLSEMKVVATGGLGKLIADETDLIDVYDSNLTMTGLQLIFQRNKK